MSNIWTQVNISEKSRPNDEEGIKWFKSNTEGWANFLCCLKAYLEYGINLRKGAFEKEQMPAEENNEALRQWRINSWKDRIAPDGYAFPGDPRRWEQTKYGIAELNELGKKLLGLEKW